MRWSIAAAIVIALAGVASTCSTAAAQRAVVTPVPPAVNPGPVILPTPAPNLNPGITLPAPILVTPQPAIPLTPVIQQPVIATPIPPPACTVRTSSDCAQDASSCLAASAITSNYAIEWRDGAPLVVRTADNPPDDQESAAQDCAADLQRCLSGQC